MALTLQISATELKNSFVVYDCTGKFSSSNPGGYGVHNPDINHVQDAYLLIWSPNLPKGADPYKVKVYPDMPNKENLGYEVLPYMIGQQKNELESGKYKIKFVESGIDKSGVPFEKSALFVIVFVNNITCCIDKLIPKIGPDPFKDERQKKIIELSNLLESVCQQIKNELYDKADENIEYMKGQCKCSGC